MSKVKGMLSTTALAAMPVMLLCGFGMGDASAATHPTKVSTPVVKQVFKAKATPVVLKNTTNPFCKFLER